jgi:chromosome segregation ATPase
VLVKAALAAKEAKLREKFSSGANRMPTFIEIYNDLVSYGDVCTDSTARRLITDSVSAATASVAPDGSVVVQPNISRETVIAALTLKLAQTKAEEAESKFRDAERELATLLLQRTSASNDSARLTQLAKDKEREIAETAEQVKSAEAAAKAAADSLAAAQKKLDGLPSDASSDARSAAKKEVEDAKIAKGIAEGALAQVKARSNAAQQAKTTALDQAKEQDAIVQSADKLLGEKRQAVIAAKKVWDDAKAAIPSK